MAYTSSVAVKSVFGNVRIAILSCTADAAAGNVSGGGLGYIFAAALDPISMPTSTNRAISCKINVLESGTAAVGSVGISGLVNGDCFYVTLYGRS